VAKLLPNPNAQGGDSVQGESNDEAITRLTQAHRILTSGFISELHLSFLYKSSHSDPLIMSNLKKTLEERSAGLGGRTSILHNCAVATHGYLNLGTTGDGFLRDNLEWMKKASNWYGILLKTVVVESHSCCDSYHHNILSHSFFLTGQSSPPLHPWASFTLVTPLKP
jgi:26S proteasome regulatory subunit N2